MVEKRLSNDTFIKDTNDPTNTKTLEDDTETSMIQAYNKAIRKLIKAIKKSMKNSDDIEKAIGLDALQDLKDVQAEFDKIESGLNQDLAEIMGLSVENAYRRGSIQAQTQLNRIQTYPTVPRLSQKDQQVIQLLLNADFSLIKTLSATNIQKAKDLFIDGLSNGLTDDEIISNIMIATGGGHTQIKRIVRTELTRTSNIGAKKRYEQSGQKFIQWNTAIDERVCPICKPLHKKVVKIGESFTIYLTGKGQKLNKGKQIKLPPAHPNCRCGITPAFKKTKIIKKASKLPIKDKKPEIKMKGFNRSEKKEFKQLIQILPQQIRDKVKEFNGTKVITKTKGILVDDKDVQDILTPDIRNQYRDTSGLFVKETEKRVFVDNTTGKDELLHESGHSLYFDYIDTNTKLKNKWNKIWTEQKESGELPSARSSLTEDEMFSDCFRFYLLRKEWLRLNYPSLYKFMKEEIFFGNTDEKKVSLEKCEHNHVI